MVKMRKTAMITGIFGQDAAYLSKHLLGKGYEVIGTNRRTGSAEPWRLSALGIQNDINMVHMDLLEFTNVHKVIEKYKPDEIYNLAAQSFVAPSFETPQHTFEVNTLGVVRILEAVKKLGFGDTTAFYQASTSEMFGKVQETPQTEKTPFYPRSPYGIAKLAAYWVTVNYREAYSMFACNGLLFNHESELRGAEFVTRKISRAVASIYNGVQDKLVIGNPDAYRDWGHAEDYVKAMHMMLTADSPSDYVVATGETHSVREFVDVAFAVVGTTLSWEGEGSSTKAYNQDGKLLVEISDAFYRPTEVELLQGDASKITRELGWKPTVTFGELVRRMVEYDIDKTNHEKGTPKL